MNEMPDILVASPRKGNLCRLGSPWRPRKASLASLLSGQTSPAQITIVDIDSPLQLEGLEALAAILKQSAEAAGPSYVILSLNMPEDIEAKSRILQAFDYPERVEISDGRRQVPGLLANVVAKIRAISMKKPRPSPLDDIKEVVGATSRLRGPNGKLSAVPVAKLYGTTLAQLADWLGRSRQTVTRTPDADLIQDKLEYFERVARLLTVLPEDDFRRWLRMPNPNLSNETPLAWLSQKRWQPLADLVDDMLTGSPT